MVLGFRIRELRKSMGMSQYDLGKLIGVSKVSISGYEKGTRVPSMAILDNMLDVFNISADYLLGREINAVCESDESMSLLIAKNDIDIIREIKKRPTLYKEMVTDPKRFLSSIDKKKI